MFRIFGIDVKLHFSWWFIFALLAWSLSSAFFPHFYPDLTTKTHWFMGIAASLLLFVSVLLHELAHSLVAKARKIKVESITLFFFGGVAGIEDEEMKPRDELQMALAGPFFSLFLAGICFLIFKFNGNAILTGIMFYLYQLNLILAIFNLVPGYPLDGGRALRAILHARYHDLKKATRIAAKGGKFFAGFLIFLGIILLFRGMNGLWFILLGGFLYFIAGMSYEQVVIKDTLAKIPIKTLMEKNFPQVSPDLTFAEIIKKVYAGKENFVVQKNGKFIGILDLQKIARIPVQQKTKISKITVPRAKIKPLSSKDNCYQAFRSMLKQDLNLLPVMKGNILEGVITKKVLMHRLILELKYGFSSNHTLKKAKNSLKTKTNLN